MIYLSATRTMPHTAVHFHLKCASFWTPLINPLFLFFIFYFLLWGELNGTAAFGMLMNLSGWKIASAGILHCNTLWRFHLLPLILRWQLSFSPPLKSHFQSLMAVMSLRSLDSDSKCHWHNGRQPLASFDHPCCVQEQLELKLRACVCVCGYVCTRCLHLCLAATLRQSSTNGNLKFTFK